MLVTAAGAQAQAASAAAFRQVSLTAGGTASIFQPDFADTNWSCANTCGLPASQVNWYPVAQASNQAIFGAGAFVDMKVTHWVQIEAEGRWLRFNQFNGIRQYNYLIGPRVPVFHFRRSSVYAKALGGYSKMDFGTGFGSGTFTDFAFGGGVDVRLTRRLSLRAVDAEYQYWPFWSNSTLSPYGASVGVGYKIF